MILIICILLLVTIITLNVIYRFESLIMFLFLSFIAFSTASWTTLFILFDLKHPMEIKDILLLLLFISSTIILGYNLFKLIKRVIKQLKESDTFNRIESSLLLICYGFNLVGIYLNFFEILFSILLLGLGFTILLSPNLLLYFIFKKHHVSSKWTLIIYLITTNVITLGLVLWDRSYFGRLDFIWPTINIVTGVIWTILLLLHQKTGSKDNVCSNCSDMAGSKISFQNN